ncbi:MAG: nitrate reductase cytochrome c-type subunit [Alphaproteobacteria bacterium]
MKLTLSVAACAVGLLMVNAAASQEVKSLHGDLDIDQENGAVDIAQQNTAGRFERAYRQQPPLIPHRIEGYEIDLKVNQWLSCHDWPNNVEQGAPKVSETHYVSRDGVALDRVARTRWFCTQCHAPQANTPELVRNSFKNANDVD